jgi:hypothetical protein
MMRSVTITIDGGVREGTAYWRHGETVCLTSEDAAKYVSLGWAKDAVTGEHRRPSAKAVTVHADDSVQKALA